MRALILVFLLGMFTHLGFTQQNPSIFDTRNIYDEKGDFYAEKGKPKKAIAYFNMAYQADANNYYAVLRKADIYTSLGLLEHAAECYRIIFETNLFIPNEYRLKFAKILLKNKDIKGFERWMSEYNEIVNTEISGYLSSTETRAKMYKDSSIVIVENENILNTTESEISPSVYKDRLVFASTRKNLSGSKRNAFYNFYVAKYLSEGQLGKLNKFNKNLLSKDDETSIFFSEATNKIYFTRSSSLDSELKTYMANIPADVNDKVTIDEFRIENFSNIGHPAFNRTGTKVYFVSDAPGGSGGMDIYVSELKNGNWSTPKNLGATINSGRDDLYPHIVNDELLYFTSNRSGGLGGYDLYSVNLKQENTSPKNLGNKVNTKYDDYALSFSTEGLTGYFCSNRPGGFGEEDIYRLQLLDLKIKYAAYRHKKRSSMDVNKINLYMSNGEEYNIASAGNTGFKFSFKPEENYKMVIQQENVLATDVINNNKLSADQRKQQFLTPKPLNKTEIKLTPGMNYEFTAGMQAIGSNYKAALEGMAAEYDNTSSTIDLTALAKELQLRKGEIYTIRFVKDDNIPAGKKEKEESSLSINDHVVPTAGNSFFFVLPLDIEANFNIKTDIAHFKQRFNPKKVGGVKVDNAPVIKDEVEEVIEGFPILVNTESFGDINAKGRITAKELTIIPGTMYMLTLSKSGEKAGKYPEIVIPLTKGVKYNLGTETQSMSDFNNVISRMSTGTTDSDPDEELIDISVLSKELDMLSQKDIVFNLIPIAKMGAQPASAKNVVTTLDVDGRKFFVTDKQKLQINLKLDQTKKVNIQTDLSYVQENFEASTIKMTVDTKSFNDDIITDPVFDVIVVNFDLDKYTVRPDAKVILDRKVVKELTDDPRLYVTIKGYTDGLGNVEHNEKLSGDRAHAVKNYLASKGIGENRIRTFSFGESYELDQGVKWEDLSEAELQKHRKVEIVIYIPDENK